METPDDPTEVISPDGNWSVIESPVSEKFWLRIWGGSGKGSLTAKHGWQNIDVLETFEEALLKMNKLYEGTRTES